MGGFLCRLSYFLYEDIVEEVFGGWSSCWLLKFEHHSESLYRLTGPSSEYWRKTSLMDSQFNFLTDSFKGFGLARLAARCRRLTPRAHGFRHSYHRRLAFILSVTVTYR